VCGHQVTSPTEGEKLVVVFHDEPLKAPSFDTVLESNIKILHFLSSVNLQICAANKLVMSPSHPGPIVIKIFPMSEVGENPNNLQD
jgi:hypothetical protein